MAFVVGLLLVVVSLDLAKTCKEVNYKFTHYGFKSEYITGCTKGCYLNDTRDQFGSEPGDVEIKDIGTAQQHPEIKKCTPCEDIKGNLTDWGVQIGYTTPSEVPDSERAEWFCNQQITCHWVGGKCKAISCPLMYKKETCGTRHFSDGPDGKKYGWRNDKCSEYEAPAGDCKKGCDDEYDLHMNDLPDPSYKGGADKLRAQCKYHCDHPDYESKQPKDRHKYEYTKAERKYSHRVFGCLFALDNQFSHTNGGDITSPVQDGSINTGFMGGSGAGYGVKDGLVYPSRWSVWAFVVTLVLLILFVVGIIGAIIVLVFVGGSSSKSGSKA